MIEAHDQEPIYDIPTKKSDHSRLTEICDMISTPTM